MKSKKIQKTINRLNEVKNDELTLAIQRATEESEKTSGVSSDCTICNGTGDIDNDICINCIGTGLEPNARDII